MKRLNIPEADRVTYHHVGSGITLSQYFCSVCDGWYGVPHDDGYVHTKRHKFSEGCACRSCQERSGRYPDGGVFLTHEVYLSRWGVIHG